MFRVFLTAIVLAFLLFAGTSCNLRQGSALSGDATISKIFAPEEIKDLEIIQEFFDDQICDLQQVQSDSVKDCYSALFALILKGESTGNLYIPVSFEAQKEMYSRLSQAAFKDIWLAGQVIGGGEQDRRIVLSYEGKYMEFLEALKNDHPILGAYYSSFLDERRMSTTMIETVMYGSSQYNLSDARMRLFIALHYLTLNDELAHRG